MMVKFNFVSQENTVYSYWGRGRSFIIQFLTHLFEFVNRPHQSVKGADDWIKPRAEPFVQAFLKLAWKSCSGIRM